MGLFQSKQQTQSQDDQIDAAIDRLFDEALREELRERSRTYFEKVIADTAEVFKKDLETTVATINTDLRQQMTQQVSDQTAEINKANTELRESISKKFDEQFAQFGDTLKSSQDLAIDSLNKSVAALAEEHKQLSQQLQKSIANQDALMVKASEENEERIREMTDAQAAALEWLNKSVQILQEQHEQMRAYLQQDVAKQEAILVRVFEDNMSRIIEHYLLGALGDQFDLKAQLPSIIKQMEANKQAIVDDMKL